MYFSQAFSDHFPDARAICCAALPPEVANRHGFIGHYRYYYQGYIPAPQAPDPEREIAEDSPYADPLEAAATEDAQRLIDEQGIGPDDCLFFPSLDFYGVAGLLNALAGVPPARQPRVLLRFIGVMEHASKRYRAPGEELLARVRRAIRDGMRIAVSAETPRLADRLALGLRQPVTVTPYPSIAEPSDLPSDGSFVCFCPGSARLDKGFLHLHEVFRHVREADPALSIRFVVQDLPAREATPYQDYVSQLYSLPGMTMLGSQISEQDMHRHYRACSLVVLPYDHRTYELRGSAAMMEAVSHARPVVAFDGCAFSEQVRYFGIGTVVDGARAMAEAILAHSREERSLLGARARQARHRFIGEAMDAYARWFREDTRPARPATASGGTPRGGPAGARRAGAAS
ncbi:hypothetical protein ISF6_5226 [Piscinibacter sakaiensis]|uniref:Glycosyltransferase n=1 Tax=Piscinibacter sakaiensis TaxID=1547922 RepID=A0A0K8P7Q2_PISS1|nr:hypothetical protein ISF6_5226 [Piscinibacter sakaiensis]